MKSLILFLLFGISGMIFLNPAFSEVTVIERAHWIDIESTGELLEGNDSNLVILSMDVENIHDEPLTITKFFISDINGKTFSSSFYSILENRFLETRILKLPLC